MRPARHFASAFVSRRLARLFRGQAKGWSWRLAPGGPPLGQPYMVRSLTPPDTSGLSATTLRMDCPLRMHGERTAFILLSASSPARTPRRDPTGVSL